MVEEKENNAILRQGKESKQLLLIQFAHQLTTDLFFLRSTVVKIFTFFSKCHFSPVWYVMTNDSWAASKGFYCPPSRHPLRCFFRRNWRHDDETVSHACISTCVFVRTVIDRLWSAGAYPGSTYASWDRLQQTRDSVNWVAGIENGWMDRCHCPAPYPNLNLETVTFDVLPQSFEDLLKQPKMSSLCLYNACAYYGLNLTHTHKHTKTNIDVICLHVLETLTLTQGWIWLYCSL